MDKLVENPDVSLATLRIRLRQQMRLLARRLASMSETDATAVESEFIRKAKTEPLAEAADAINEEFYEVDRAIWAAYLGPRGKYSASLFPSNTTSLEEAELLSLEDYVEKAGLEDGQQILDIGCGYGAVALYLAERFPNSRITALSLSKSQIDAIRQEMASRGIKNIDPVVGDMAKHEFKEASFDRILAIEVLEYVSNPEDFFARIAGWLRPSGRLFTQLLAHPSKTLEAPAELAGILDGSRFVSVTYLLNFQRNLHVVGRWWLGGEHAGRTNEEWLVRFDANAAAVRAALAVKLPPQEVELEMRRQRWTFASRGEMFTFEDGDFFGMAYLLMEKTSG